MTARKKGKKSSLNEANGEEEDLDSLLAEFAHGVSKCGVNRCKGLMTVSHVCTVCKLRFCLAHRMAENHGCGDGMKKIEVQKQKKKLQSDPNAKPLQQLQRTQLEQKLKTDINSRKIGRSGGRSSSTAAK
eukprot:CFRG6362T1